MRTPWIFAIFVALTPLPALAQVESPQALRQVYACAAITGETERLACYDAAVGGLQQAETQGRIIAVDRDQAEVLERESFGFSLPSMSRIFSREASGPAEEPVARVEMTVTRIARYGDGRHAFIMSNGQTWTQIEPQSVSNVDVGDTIAIRRASLGSYMLSPLHGRGHRVRRAE
jgi:hypothetical protein